MFKIDLLSLFIGAIIGGIITFIFKYLFIYIREKKRTNRIKELIKAELLENEKMTNSIQLQLNKKAAQNNIAHNILEIKKEIITQAFSYAALNVSENEMGDLRFSTDYINNIKKLYSDLKRIEKIIKEAPSVYVLDDEKKYRNKISEKINSFRQELRERV